MAIAGSACRARQAPSSDTRENAYRANNVGVALLEQANYEQAAAAFRRALQIDPALAIAHVNLSLALQYSQDLAGAAREAAEAGRLMPSAPQPPYISGLVARAENRREDAIRFFEHVRQLDSRDVGARVNLAQLYLEDRKYADAIALLQPAVGDEPYNVTAAYTLGLALTRGGDSAEGRRMLERSQTLRSTGYAVAFGTGYLEQGRYAEGIASTGAEPELVDQTLAAAGLTRTVIPAASRFADAGESPFGRSFDAHALGANGAQAMAAAMGGCLATIDFDGDGDLDIFEATAEGQRLMRNDGATWTDVTRLSGLDPPPGGGVPIGCLAADYDNDGRPDLFVLRYGSSVLYRNEGHGVFRDVSVQAHLPPYAFLPGAAAFVDVDHDGDVDLVIAGLADVEGTRAAGRPAVFPRDFAPAPLQLLRNNGNGTFTEITREAGLQASGHAIAVVPTDFDNHRDIDLLVVYRDAPPKLFKNQRDGTFKDVAAEVGLGAIVGAGDEVTAVTAADVNKDDFPDFFFSRARGASFAFSDGQGRFTIAAGPEGAGAAVAAQFADYDADGLLDLLTWSADSLHVFRNLGRQWSDVTATAVRAGGPSDRASVGSGRRMAVADMDRDGFADVVTGGPAISLWHNSGDPRHRSQRVVLKGVVSNRLAIGSKIQIRAGSLSARIETSAATPPVAAVDGLFGLGGRTGADVVRVLWPSGILQTETAAVPVTPAAAPPRDPPVLPSPMVVTELDRKPSSCPFLFTWDGARFQFVTDFMGAGEMGYWEGPRQWNRPSPVEYVRITGSQLQAKDGRFDIRVTNELEEALFADRLQLVAISHPADLEVFPNEGMTDPPKPFHLHVVRDERVPVKVTDDHGHDVTERIARVDRRYPDDFDLERFRGYAKEHTLTIDAGPPSAPITLLLTAWTDYAFSSDNRAAHQAGLALTSPALQARDAAGRWRTVIADIGIPVGRPQTIALDLSGKLRAGEHELRIVTNMRIYWDQIHVGTTVPSGPWQSMRLDPVAAILRARGFSAEVRPDGKEPARYDYAQVTASSPWKVMPGRYTREGDVRELLVRSDDEFVIAKPGDEISIQFDATAAGPLPDGWTRTFLLMADGFSKEMDVNSASPDVLDPLPFHAMTRYPYAAPEHYPDTPAHQRYLETYNRRVVARPLPPLDLSLIGRERPVR